MFRPRSLRLRYTLRALLVFITLFCLWGGYHANRAIKERRAQEVLAKHNEQHNSQARSDIASYLAYYNLDRRHSSLNYLTRAAFEAQLTSSN